jgi:Cyclin
MDIYPDKGLLLSGSRHRVKPTTRRESDHLPLSLPQFVDFLEQRLTVSNIASVPAAAMDPTNLFSGCTDDPRQELRDILEHLVHFSPTYFESFLMALVYIERLQEQNEFGYVNIETVGKLFALGLVVAEKVLCDCSVSNKLFSKTFLLDLGELKELEVEFLRRISFQCFVSRKKFTKVWAILPLKAPIPKHYFSFNRPTYEKYFLF